MIHDHGFEIAPTSIIAVVNAYAELVPAVHDQIMFEASYRGLSAFTEGRALWRDGLERNAFQVVSFDDRADSIQDVVGALVALTDFIERGLGRHMNAVGRLAMKIANVRGHSSNFIATCGIAGQLHDIGKVVMPARILRKPAALTVEEYEAIKLHSEAGDYLLRGTPLLAHFATIVRGHHERIDGGGYPDNLRGSEIPEESRVIAVADAFDAMTADRVYRAPLSDIDAVRLIVQRSGKHFDSGMVDALLDVLRISRRAVA